MASDPYSQLVAFLKVALPLLALGILSTMFLVSSRIEPGDTIPFPEVEVTERIRGQQVTGPLFSGATSGGDQIRFAAEEMTTSEAGANAARNPRAQVDLAGGGSVQLEADRGNVDMIRDTITMTGNVVIESTTGYVIQSQKITGQLSQLQVVSPGPVAARGPAGTLNAGRMEISQPAGKDAAQLLFTNGVKLIYDPKETE